MVFAVQCPEPKCRKYMLVEEENRGKIVLCLVCKTPIRVGQPEPEELETNRPRPNRPT